MADYTDTITFDPVGVLWVEAAQPVPVEVELTAVAVDGSPFAGLVHQTSGYTLDSSPRTLVVDPARMDTVQLIPTDLPVWRDLDGLAVDVGTGGHTHAYRLRIRRWAPDRRHGPWIELDPFVVPAAMVSPARYVDFAPVTGVVPAVRVPLPVEWAAVEAAGELVEQVPDLVAAAGQSAAGADAARVAAQSARDAAAGSASAAAAQATAAGQARSDALAARDSATGQASAAAASAASASVSAAAADSSKTAAAVSATAAAGSAAAAQAQAVQSAGSATAAANSAAVSLAGLAREPAALVAGAITRNTAGVVTSAAVVWPDGATGVYTPTLAGATVSSYTITHVLGGVTTTYTQPAVTRDPTTGVVTVVPAITVS